MQIIVFMEKLASCARFVCSPFLIDFHPAIFTKIKHLIISTYAFFDDLVATLGPWFSRLPIYRTVSFFKGYYSLFYGTKMQPGLRVNSVPACVS